MLRDEIKTRTYLRQDGAYEIDFFLKDDMERAIGRVIIHEEKDTKLFRKLRFSFQTRLDNRVRGDSWQMRVFHAVGRVLK